MSIRKITSYDIEKAAEFWKKNPGHNGFRNSIKYDVIINGEPYPPKAIISIAHENARLGNMPHSSFAGAKDGRWHSLLKNLGFRIFPKGVIATESQDIGESAWIHNDLEDVKKRHRDNPTMRATLTMARIGQGQYRKELLALWGNQCAVTGCSVLPVLRASHAKPWRDSSDEERLDPNNGVPLMANLDALFDVGLIGFDQNGTLLVSKKLQDKKLLDGVPSTLRRRPTLEQAQYLEEHWISVFQGDLYL